MSPPEVVRDLLHLRKPNPIIFQDVLQRAFEHAHAVRAADDLGMHGQDVADVAALVVHPGEVVAPDLLDF